MLVAEDHAIPIGISLLVLLFSVISHTHVHRRQMAYSLLKVLQRVLLSGSISSIHNILRDVVEDVALIDLLLCDCSKTSVRGHVVDSLGVVHALGRYRIERQTLIEFHGILTLDLKHRRLPHFLSGLQINLSEEFGNFCYAASSFLALLPFGVDWLACILRRKRLHWFILAIVFDVFHSLINSINDKESDYHF